MPLGVIEQKRLTRKQTERLEYLALLRYPQERLILRHLHREDFRSWLYLISPRTALLFANANEGHAIIHYQTSKRWYHEVKDWLWRVSHGNC